VEVKSNWTHQLIVYGDDVNLLGHNINIIKKNTQALSEAGKEVGQEVSTEKIKHIFISRHQKAG
jgi:hypothetical protein